MSRPEELLVEPVLAALAREVLARAARSSPRRRLVERDEEVGRAEVAVVLRDLVLEDEVVAERVPGELAGQPVVLVQVLARVGEDEVGLDGLQTPRRPPSPRRRRTEDSRRGTRERGPPRCRRRRGRPRRSLSPPRRGRPGAASTTHVTCTSGRGARQGEQRASAADLDVVGMAADGEDAANRRAAAEG